MKLLVVLLFISIPIIIFTLLFLSFDNDKKSKPKNVRNFKVRFDAAREKYYIVNELETHDEPVTNWFGLRVMYKDQPKAEFVSEKLNS